MDATPIGTELKRWRTHRRRSQMDVALDAEISPRHLSFVETGRSRPSRDLVMRLADCLAVPPRGRNAMLVSAGFAPLHSEHSLESDALAAARAAVSHVLSAYAPYPALAVDRHWTLIEANAPLLALLGSVAPHLMQPPVNVLKVSLHPEGIAPLIANLAEWRGALFQRLREQIEASADPVLTAMLGELRALPGGEAPAQPGHSLAVPLVIDHPAGRLSFLSMTSVFGSPVDITLSEMAVESFLPADAATMAVLQAIA